MIALAAAVVPNAASAPWPPAYVDPTEVIQPPAPGADFGSTITIKGDWLAFAGPASKSVSVYHRVAGGENPAQRRGSLPGSVPEALDGGEPAPE